MLRTLLAPVLLIQGRRMFKALPRLREPPGDRKGTAGTGTSLRLLVAGDSSAAGVGADTQEEALLGRTVSWLAETNEVTWALYARYGSTIPQTLSYLSRQETSSFDAAVLAVGMNDMFAGAMLGPWLDAYRELVDLVREHFGVRHVVISGMPLVGEFPAVPNPLRWILGRQADRFNAALGRWADSDPDLTFIELGFSDQGMLSHGEVTVAEVMASDGFHPGPRVYDEWGRRAASAIQAHRRTASSQQTEELQSVNNRHR